MSEYNKNIDMNNVTISGGICRVPNLRKVGANNTSVCDLRLAITNFKNITYIDVTIWGERAKIATQYLKLGSKIHLIGRLNLEEWTDKKDGSKRSKIGIVSDNFQFLPGKPPEQNNNNEAKVQENEEKIGLNELPFSNEP